MKTSIAEGQRIQYSFVKPHMALNGETSAKKSGVEIKDKNKWMTLLQNSTRTIQVSLAIFISEGNVTHLGHE
jgi:hypothetical protein